MKGLSLPINVIVIIAIAILVLVVLAAFFGLNFGISSQSITREQALNSGCREFRDLYNCAGNFATIKVKYVEQGRSAGTSCGPGPNDLCPLQELCTLSGLDTGGAYPSECAKVCGCT